MWQPAFFGLFVSKITRVVMNRFSMQFSGNRKGDEDFGFRILQVLWLRIFRNMKSKKLEIFTETYWDWGWTRLLGPSQSRWLELDNSGENGSADDPLNSWPGVGNSASLIGPAREPYQEDNRERAGWLVNQGHGVCGGGRARCGRCTVHWCRGMFGRISVFVFGAAGHAPHHQSWTWGFMERWAAQCSHGYHCHGRLWSAPFHTLEDTYSK